jgi:hypothetical protein
MDRAHKAFWNRPAKRVKPPYLACVKSEEGLVESGSLGLLPKSGDKLPPRLNIDGKPIANKYCEGKMKRTLKRGLKDLKPLRRKLWELANVGND